MSVPFKYLYHFRKNTLDKSALSIHWKWSSTSDKFSTGWSIYYDLIKDYIDPTYPIYEKIAEMDKRILCKEFNEADLEKIASFVMNEGKSGEAHDKVTMEEAQLLVQRWENEA